MKVEDEILVHIGYHKTGSTFLQKRVFPALSMKQLMFSMDQIANREDFDPDTVTSSLAGQYQISIWDKERVLISQESLVGHKEGEPIWDRFVIARNLKSTFPNAKILIVIRNQFDYILSLYTFMVYVKGSERRSLERFLLDNMSMEPGLRGALQYDILVDYYQTLFGTGNVLVLPYELLAQNEGCFVKRISEYIGWKFETNFETGRVNSSNRNRSIILTSRLINYPFSLMLEGLIKCGVAPSERPNSSRLEISYALVRKKIVNPGLEWLFSQKTGTLEIPSNWKSFMTPIFSESNRRLTQMISLDLKNYGYPY